MIDFSKMGLDRLVAKAAEPLLNKAQASVTQNPEVQAAMQAAKESYEAWQRLKWVLAFAGVTVYLFYYVPRFKKPWGGS